MLVYYDKSINYTCFYLVNEENQHIASISNHDDSTEDKPDQRHADHHRNGEQVNLALEYSTISSPGQNAVTKGLKALPRRYLRLSTLATINHVKKFIALKALNCISKYSTVRIFIGASIKEQ